jgi:hypothetical protein
MRANERRPFTSGTPSRIDRPAAPLSVAARFAYVGRAPPRVCVSSTPCSAGIRPVRSVARLGEHMHEFTNARVNVRPVRFSSASFGVRSASQPGRSGQCIG